MHVRTCIPGPALKSGFVCQGEALGAAAARDSTSLNLMFGLARALLLNIPTWEHDDKSTCILVLVVPREGLQ
jgi:hypothetical protein